MFLSDTCWSIWGWRVMRSSTCIRILLKDVCGEYVAEGTEILIVQLLQLKSISEIFSNKKLRDKKDIYIKDNLNYSYAIY